MIEATHLKQMNDVIILVVERYNSQSLVFCKEIWTKIAKNLLQLGILTTEIGDSGDYEIEGKLPLHLCGNRQVLKR